MKNIKTTYKIILTIVFVILFAVITGGKSLAVTQPRYAPDGDSWNGWFCAQSGYSYWNKYSYYGSLDAYDYQLKKTISHSTGYGSTSTEKMYWHMLGYVLNYADEHDAKFVVNHYKDSKGHHIAGTAYDRSVQDAIWQILRACSAIKNEFGTGTPGYSCGCGSNLIAKAKESWNSGSPKERYEFKIEIWKDNLGYKVSRGYLRQPLLKINSVEEKKDDPKPITLKFYKVDKEGSELSGAEIKVTTTEGTITGSLTKSESQNGYFGTLKITPNADSNDGSIKIKISEIKTPKGYDSISDITLTVNYDVDTGKVISITEPTNTDTYKNSKGVGIIKIINKSSVPTVKVHFYKWNADVSKRLGGAEIDVEKGTNVSEMSKTLYTSSAKKGYLGYVTVIPVASNPGKFKIKVKETTAPAGYNKIPETTLTISYNKTTGKITNIESSDENCAYGIENSKGVKIVRVLNHSRIVKNMTILKTDFNGNPLANVKFDVYLNNISYIKIGDVLYFVEQSEYDEMIKQNEELDEEDKYNGNEIVLLKVDEEKSLKYVVDGKETSIKIKRLANGTDTNRLRIYDISTNSKGQIVFPEMMISKGFKDRTVYITIYEAGTPEGYEKLPNDLRLLLKYDQDIKNWKLIERNKDVETNEDYWNKLDTKYWDTFNDNTVKIQLYNQKIPAIQIGGDPAGSGFNKVATGNSDIKVAGAEFTAVFTQDDKQIASIKATSDSNGHVSFAKVQPTTKSEVTVKITETKLPVGWTGSYSKTITFTYDSTNQTWIENDETVSTQLVDNTVHVGIPDVPNFGNIEKLTILKKDPLNPSANLDDAEFKITLTNVSKVGGSDYTGAITKKVTSGKIVLEDLEITNLKNDIKITIEETKEPTAGDGYYYKKIDGIITITLKRDGNKYTTSKVETSGNILESEVKAETISVNNHEVQLIVNNLERIDLEGQVWVDGQIGNKDVDNSYNGTKESSEKKVQNLTVYLLDSKGEIVKQDGLTNPVITNENGEYSFVGVIRKEEGYKIGFKYNGILYEDVGIEGDSKAAEEEAKRTEFNNRFKIITKGKTNDNTELKYNYNDKESKLYINDSLDIQAAAASNPATGTTYSKQAIIAYTDVYTKTAKDIHCGILEKYFDLEVSNLVKNVKYTINGKEWFDNPDVDRNDVYQGKISSSDYHYRFDDDRKNTETIEIKPLKDIKNNGHELKVNVTYNLQVSNKSIHNVTGAKVKYTYNKEVFKLINVNGEDKGDTGSFELTVSDFTKPIQVVFELRLEDKDKWLKDGELELTGWATAEIISYTTEDGGLIDNDSEPGNGKDADDISKRSINFEFEENERVISGKVAKDNDGDGKLDTEQINGVIVQLIELIEKDGILYEYIWQETATGSNIVKARTNEKNAKEMSYVYENNLEEEDINGKYQFLGYSATAKDSTGNVKENVVGFIPGNYIIRFIYGDGTTAYYNAEGDEVRLTDMTYNGQDYKSTIDKNYKEKNYDKSKYETGESTARDNEARRLETMAFSTEIDGGLGVALNTLNQTGIDRLTEKEKTLLKDFYKKLQEADNDNLEYAYQVVSGKNVEQAPNIADLSDSEIFNIVKCYVSFETWMCAETSKINVEENASTFNEINFGLMERPNTELVVEKHITALKITPTGVGVQAIVDAKADIKNVLAGNTQKTGVTTGLAIIPSTRNDRGFWKVETDIEELTQGAKLEVEYTYVIRNKSEKDYLSAVLFGLYDNNPEEYANKLKEFSDNYSKETTIGTYLGQYYYTGNPGSGDKEVLSRVNYFEETLNNQLSYESATMGTFFNEVSKPEGKEKHTRYYYTVGGVRQEKEIETILINTNPSDILCISDSDETPDKIENVDTKRTLKLETTLANAGEQGITIPTYLTQVTSYSNAAGRKDKKSVPANLDYVHSDDNDITLETYSYVDGEKTYYGPKDSIPATATNIVKLNEADEFWGESIIISKPTGEDKNIAMIITIIAISAAAVIGAGIILIKKYALKK